MKALIFKYLMAQYVLYRKKIYLAENLCWDHFLYFRN